MRWGRFATLVVAVAVNASALDARAMNVPVAAGAHCTVIGGDKLPAEIGGADALCAAIRRAIAAQAPTAHYTAKLRVVSASRLAAAVTVDGQDLPEQKLSVMDRNLDPVSIEHFVQSLATKVARAARP